MQRQPGARRRHPKRGWKRNKERADNRTLPRIGDNARRQIRETVEEVGRRPLDQNIPDPREKRVPERSGRRDLQASGDLWAFSDQPAQMAYSGPVRHDQIAGGAILLGELDGNVPCAAAQKGNGELFRDDQAVRIDRRGKADADFVGQRPMEGPLLDQPGRQDLRLEIGAVPAGKRGEIGGVAERHRQAPQQRQPVLEFGKQVEGEKKAVAGRLLLRSSDPLEQPFPGNRRIVPVRQLTKQHRASLPIPRSAHRMACPAHRGSHSA
ncbi:hypothetical protein [Mesorhizobium sp. KR9-304]|uniref:hypothetical protein n=1 Tax=Mesorhizobium sp. KR9-304 TaxID=3156614 RepID=UPI0032B4D3C1